LPPYAERRRPDPWKVAEELGIDGKTVKSRMEKWEKTGFIKYYQAVPNYNLLGIESSAFAFVFDDIVRKYEVLKKMELVDGVLSILNLLGNTFLLWLAYEDEKEMEKRLALLAEVTGCPKPPKIVDDTHDPVKLTLSSLDWEIIRCLRYNALKPYSKIARDCGFTRKTVKLHLERMVDKSAFYIRAIFDASAVTGLVFYSLAVTLDPVERRNAIKKLDEIFRVNSFARFVAPKAGAFYSLWSTNAGAPEDSYVKARSVKGVVSAETSIFKEVLEFPEMLDRLIAKKISETTKRTETAIAAAA
jgi:DNA-binding Lrp family transcriptional regulator